MPPRVSNAVHAGDRLQERFGFKLDEAAYKELQGLLKNCKWTPIEWQGQGPNGKLRVLLHFRGKDMHVVFNVSTWKIITVIPVAKPIEDPKLVQVRTWAQFLIDVEPEVIEHLWRTQPEKMQGLVDRLEASIKKQQEVEVALTGIPLDETVVLPKKVTQEELDAICAQDGHRFNDFKKPCGVCRRSYDNLLSA